MKKLISFGVCLVAGTLMHVTNVNAQAPIDIERKAAEGDYMAALTLYDKMPKRIATSLSTIAAAKSAWALGLADRAIAEYDNAMRSGKLTDLQLARADFAKGAIFLQEHQPQLSILAVDDGLAKLKDPSPLRGAMLVLKAQALQEQGYYPGTVEILMKAKSEVDEDSRVELNYLLGASLSKVGRYAEAKESLKTIPSTHDRAVDGLRELIKISDAERDFPKAAFWVRKGREAFPDAFLDGWYDYLLVTGAIASDARDDVFELRDAASKRLAPSDSWLALIVAASEQYAWNRAELQRKGNQQESSRAKWVSHG